MTDSILQFVDKNKMIEPHDTVVLGISGGADSVCLLIILKELQKYIDFSMIAVHVNHCIRGVEADEDQEFARIICEKYGVPFRAFSVEVEKIATTEKISVEEAGRKTRYRIFNQVLEQAPKDEEAQKDEETQKDQEAQKDHETRRFRGKIAVAHHMDDQGETILMNILRGSGMKGICGMKPVRDNIIRPLLCVRRHEIEGYLMSKGQQYRTDSTNLANDYTRNRLRNVIFPYFEENVNVHSVENICGMAEMVSEAEHYIENMAADAANKCAKITSENKYVIDLSLFSGNDIIIKKYIIRRILSNLAGHLKDVYRVHIQSVIDLESKQVGSQVDLAYGIVAKRGYEDIVLWDKKIQHGETISEKSNDTGKEIKPAGIIADVQSAIEDSSNIVSLDSTSEVPNASGNAPNALSVPIEGDYYLKEKGLVHLSCAEFAKVSAGQKIIGNDYTKVFDYDKIKFTLQFRTRQTGDYIQIDENGGNKKLKDFFIDQKVPRDYRDSVLLLADGSHILWIVGYRMSEGYKITSETKCVLQINLF